VNGRGVSVDLECGRSEAEFRAILDAETRVLGADHPSTLATARVLKAITAPGDKP